jgi:hypothetical protein
VKNDGQSERPPIGHALLNYFWNNCNLVLTTLLKKWNNLYIFSKLIWKNDTSFHSQYVLYTLLPFGTNVWHAHPIETYMALNWNTLLPFETYVKHAHHIPTYINLMLNIVQTLKYYVKQSHPFKPYMKLMRNTLLLVKNYVKHAHPIPNYMKQMWNTLWLKKHPPSILK